MIKSGDPLLIMANGRAKLCWEVLHVVAAVAKAGCCYCCSRCLQLSIYKLMLLISLICYMVSILLIIVTDFVAANRLDRTEWDKIHRLPTNGQICKHMQPHKCLRTYECFISFGKTNKSHGRYDSAVGDPQFLGRPKPRCVTLTRLNQLCLWWKLWQLFSC